MYRIKIALLQWYADQRHPQTLYLRSGHRYQEKKMLSKLAEFSMNSDLWDKLNSSGGTTCRKDFLNRQVILSPSLSCTPGAAMPSVRTNGNSSFQMPDYPRETKCKSMQNTKPLLVKCGFQPNVALS